MRESVIEISKEHLGLEASGYRMTSEMLYDVLLKAAAEGISIEAACADLVAVVDSNTIRAQLNQQLDVVRLCEHEAAINASLAFALPEQIQRCRLEVAIDTHDEPFYGKTVAVLDVTCRSRAQRGTTRFVRIASAYVIYRQMRMTLAVTFVLPEDSLLAVVKRLYQRLCALKLQLGVLYLDKGFCSGPIIRYLQEQQQAAVLACAIRGKAAGTRQLCRGRKSYRTTYTFTDGTHAPVAAVATLVPGRDGARRRKWLLFVVVNLAWQPKTIYRRYPGAPRARFGIECSYRLLRQIRIKTTSRNPVMRFFVLGFALLLVNIWAFLRWQVARIPGPGPHRVNPAHFPLHRFVQFLRRAVENIYGVVMSISTPTSCQISIYCI
jgi:putative transposase